jgi:hypothetical protein
MANEVIWSEGTTLTLAATGTTASVSDGAVAECTDDTRTASDNTGYVLGKFEFKTASSGFSAAPTAGAVINIYECKTDGTNYSPAVTTAYLNDYIGSFIVPATDGATLYMRLIAPIYLDGAKYYIQWVDAGTASMDAGWELKLTPITYGTA